MLAADLDAYLAFYTEVFDADVLADMEEDGLRHAFLDLGRGATYAFELPDHVDARGKAEIFTQVTLTTSPSTSRIERRSRNFAARQGGGDRRHGHRLRPSAQRVVPGPGRIRIGDRLWQDGPMLRFDQRGAGALRGNGRRRRLIRRSRRHATGTRSTANEVRAARIASSRVSPVASMIDRFASSWSVGLKMIDASMDFRLSRRPRTSVGCV